MNQIVLRLLESPGYTGIFVFAITLLTILVCVAYTLPAERRKIRKIKRNPPNLRALVSRWLASEFQITYFKLLFSITLAATVAAVVVWALQEKFITISLLTLMLGAPPMTIFWVVLAKQINERWISELQRSQAIESYVLLVARFVERLTTILYGRRRSQTAKTKPKRRTLTGLFLFSFNAKFVVVFVLQIAIATGAYVLHGRGLIDPGTFSVVTCLSLTLVLLAAAKQGVLSYRVRRGYFGTNGYEAGQLIDFVRSAEDRWNNGRPSAVFQPEDRAADCPDFRAVPERHG